jgi:2-polyprenyl-3-methyl-5-hydroxy-6-metoxy-1,4-benzoquinol methylase
MNYKWKIAQYLEIRWWEKYLKERPSGKYLTWKKAYWADFLQKIRLNQKTLNGKSILDAGCGPVGIFCLLDALDCSITAIDPLLSKYTELDHFQPELYRNTNFIEISLEDFGKEDGFEYIFCLNVINHVSDLQKSFENLFRLLTPGGQLILSVDVHRFLFLKKGLQWLPLDVMHPHQYSLEEYRAMLKTAGFYVERNIELKKGRIFNYQCFRAIKKPGR